MGRDSEATVWRTATRLADAGKVEVAIGPRGREERTNEGRWREVVKDKRQRTRRRGNNKQKLKERGIQRKERDGKKYSKKNSKVRIVRKRERERGKGEGGDQTVFTKSSDRCGLVTERRAGGGRVSGRAGIILNRSLYPVDAIIPDIL